MKQCNEECCCNPVWSNLKCKYHQHKRTDDKYLNKTTPKKVAIKRDYNPSGEGILFEAILAVRPHVSFLSGLPIHNPDHNNLHHCLNKNLYSAFRLYDKNIILILTDEHWLIHNGTNLQKEVYAKEHNFSWDKLTDLIETLKGEYPK